jgi:hemolysin III
MAGPFCEQGISFHSFDAGEQKWMPIYPRAAPSFARWACFGHNRPGEEVASNCTAREELANSVTHGLGLALSVAAFALLLTLAILRGGALRIAACAVYGSTLVCLYAASTLYHSAVAPRLKRVFRIMDHSAIYLLIAGTYTPFTLILLHDRLGRTLLALVWTLALLGILLKACFVERFGVVSVVLYLALGWLGVIAVKPLLALLPVAGIVWLLAGGAAYTVGVVFYASRRLPYAHALWHVFVLAGSACHYFAILLYVLPAKA